MAVDQDEDILFYPIYLIVYPWRWWEWLIPSRWKEHAFMKKWDQAIEEWSGFDELETLLEDIESARGYAWRAQIFLARVAGIYHEHPFRPEAGVPSGARDLLEQAEEAISTALLLDTNYAGLTLRAQIRTLLGKNSEAQRDFLAADRGESQRMATGHRLLRRGLGSIEQGNYLRGRKSIQKAVRALSHERHPAIVLRMCRDFEKIDELLALCNRSQIVTIARARVRYYEYMTRMLDAVSRDIADERIRRSLGTSATQQLTQIVAAEKAKVRSAIDAERLRQPADGDFAKRLAACLEKL